MSVSMGDEGAILLTGVCPIEDAEALLQRLCDDPDATVDWSGCEQAHAAVIQVLMAAKPQLVGSPTDAFLREHLGVLLKAV
jgi:hypothetical protein